jgi:hypothetical protein
MSTVVPAGVAHLRVDDTVGSILEHAAFDGFGRLLLPWDDRRYDHAMPLRNIGSLRCTTSMWIRRRGIGANRMVDDASVGGVFYDIYTSARSRRTVTQGRGPVLLPRQAGGSRSLIARGRVRVRGVLHEGFLRCRDQQPGIQRIRPDYRPDKAAPSQPRIGGAISMSFGAESLGVATAGYRCGAARRAPGWSRRSAYGTGRFGGPSCQAIGRGDSVHGLLGSRSNGASHVRCCR